MLTFSRPSIQRYTKPGDNGQEPLILWRPFTLKHRFLIFTVTICLILIALVEVALQVSNQHEGLLFADINTGEMPGYALFCFEYLPTIISIIHSFLWMSIDHDVRRAEPFYQLSKPEGASAKESLLLDYPYQFLLSVPFSAMKNRHWAVLAGSLVSIIGSFIATPLMAAVLSQENVFRSLSFEANSRVLLPMEMQSTSVSARFTHYMYRHKYLNDTIPPFTNSSFAVLPFEPRSTFPLHTDELWTTQTTMYDAEFLCLPSQMEINGTDSNAYHVFESGKNCRFVFGECSLEYSFDSKPYSMIFMSHDAAGIYRSLGGPQVRFPSKLSLSAPSSQFGRVDSANDCPNKRIMFALFNKFQYRLAVNGSNTFEPIEGYVKDGCKPRLPSAVFCEPKYYSQQIEVEVNARTRHIHRTRVIGKRNSIDDAINSTYFQSLAAIGVISPSTTKLNVTQDNGGDMLNQFGMPDVSSVLKKKEAFRKYTEVEGLSKVDIYKSKTVEDDVTNLNLPGSTGQTLATFAISEEDDLEELMDPRRLGEDLNAAYKMFFAFALTDELTTSDGLGSPAPVLTVQRRFKTKAYVVNELFARFLQSAWIILLLLDLAIALLLHKRPLNLSNDPGSLSALMATVSGSSTLLSDFRGSEFVSFDETVKKLKKDYNQYRLVLVDELGHRIEKMHDPTESGGGRPLPHVPVLFEDAPKDIKSPKPFEISRVTGTLVLICFLVLLGVVIGVRESDNRTNGLSNFGNKEFLRRLAYTYTPTLAATLVEMFIVTLSRFLALVAPYESMRKRPTAPSSSINAYYERSPPHFLLFKAIKRNHFLFAFLIFCILLANVLTVAFGGLFLPKSIKIEHMHSFDRILSPLEGGNRPFLDVRPTLPQGEASMYFPLAQKDASLPRWTTSDFFVMPFQSVGELPERYISTNTTVTAETWGIGSTIKCHEASNAQVNVTNLRQIHRNLTTLSSASLSTEERFQVSPYGECAYSWNSTKTLDSEYEDLQKFHNLGHYQFWKDYHKPQVIPDWLNASKLFEEKIEVFEHCPGIFSAKFGAYEVKTILPQQHIIAPVLSKSLVLCNASPRIAKIRATVDLSSNVKNVTVLSEVDLNVPDVAEKFIITSNLSEYRTLPQHVLGNVSTVEITSFVFQHFLLQGIKNAPHKTRTDPRPQTWLPYLVSQESPKLSSQPYGLASADPADVASALESVYRRLFVSWLQTYEDELFNKEAMANKESVVGNVNFLEDRYKVETIMFWIVVSCLGIFVLLLVYFYIRQPGGFLKHIPTTLAATIPLVYASTITRELRQAQGFGKKDLEQFVEKLGHTYGYGWFEGTDGEKHLGIDKEPILRRRTWEEMEDMGTQFVGKRGHRVGGNEVHVRSSDDWEAIRDGSQQTLL